MKHQRQTLIKDENVHLSLENTENIGWTIHCEVTEWSLSTYKTLLTQWAEVLNGLKAMGINELYIYAHTHLPYKYACMFGFEPTNVVGLSKEGEQQELWRYKL